MPVRTATPGLSDGGSSTTSVSLLDRARRRDQSAWQWLVQLYSPLVYRWCRIWGLPVSDAADVGQDVLYAVWQSLDGFSHTGRRGAFRAWLKTIARNKARDHWRRQASDPAAGAGPLSAEPFLVDDAVGGGPEEAEALEVSWLYRRAVELLRTDFSESTWRAFWLVVIDGRPPQDVADELHLSLNAVYIAKSRVLSRLRSEFSDLVE